MIKSAYNLLRLTTHYIVATSLHPLNMKTDGDAANAEDFQDD